MVRLERRLPTFLGIEGNGEELYAPALPRVGNRKLGRKPETVDLAWSKRRNSKHS